LLFVGICRLPNKIFTVLTLKPGRFEEDGLITTFSENKKFSRFFFANGPIKFKVPSSQPVKTLNK